MSTSIGTGEVMFGELGVPELLVILGIALLIFGPRKIGELGKGLGEGIKGFRSALKDEEKKPQAPAPSTEEPKPVT
jgi:sec-independent protein translocase protein TatA